MPVFPVFCFQPTQRAWRTINIRHHPSPALAVQQIQKQTTKAERDDHATPPAIILSLRGMLTAGHLSVTSTPRATVYALPKHSPPTQLPIYPNIHHPLSCPSTQTFTTHSATHLPKHSASSWYVFGIVRCCSVGEIFL